MIAQLIRDEVVRVDWFNSQRIESMHNPIDLPIDLPIDSINT